MKPTGLLKGVRHLFCGFGQQTREENIRSTYMGGQTIQGGPVDRTGWSTSAVDERMERDRQLKGDKVEIFGEPFSPCRVVDDGSEDCKFCSSILDVSTLLFFCRALFLSLVVFCSSSLFIVEWPWRTNY